MVSLSRPLSRSTYQCVLPSRPSSTQVEMKTRRSSPAIDRLERRFANGYSTTIWSCDHEHPRDAHESLWKSNAPSEYIVKLPAGHKVQQSHPSRVKLYISSVSSAKPVLPSDCPSMKGHTTEEVRLQLKAYRSVTFCLRARWIRRWCVRRTAETKPLLRLELCCRANEKRLNFAGLMYWIREPTRRFWLAIKLSRVRRVPGWPRLPNMVPKKLSSFMEVAVEELVLRMRANSELQALLAMAAGWQLEPGR